MSNMFYNNCPARFALVVLTANTVEASQKLCDHLWLLRYLATDKDGRALPAPVLSDRGSVVGYMEHGEYVSLQGSIAGCRVVLVSLDGLAHLKAMYASVARTVVVEMEGAQPVHATCYDRSFGTVDSDDEATEWCPTFGPV